MGGTAWEAGAGSGDYQSTAARGAALALAPHSLSMDA